MADGRRASDYPECDQDGEGLAQARSVEYERDPLGHCDEKDAEGQELPALMQENRDGAPGGHKEDRHGARLGRCRCQNWREQSAQDPEGGYAARLPAHRKARGQRADHENHDQAQQRREEVVELGGHRNRHEQPRDAGGHGRQSGVRAALLLVQPDAQTQQRSRPGTSEQRPHALTDPTLGDANREEEGNADQHGQAPDPCEYAPAEKVLEAAAAERLAHSLTRGGASGRGRGWGWGNRGLHRLDPLCRPGRRGGGAPLLRCAGLQDRRPGVLESLEAPGKALHPELQRLNPFVDHDSS